MWTHLLVSLALAAPFAQEQPADAPLALRVHAAIARGVEHLKRHQRADGTWAGEEGPHPGGMTALCCYALVKSGVPRRDPAVARALATLADFPAASTYSTAVHILLLEALRDPQGQRPAAERDLAALLGWQREGLWAYPSGALDLSNTQFALLGLLAAHRMGLEVPSDALESCAKAMLRLQTETGGLRYTFDQDATGGMTAASLAGLAVIAEIGKEKPVERFLKKRADAAKAADEWLARRVAFDRNPYGEVGWTPSFFFSYLWAIERYGGLSGRERIAGRDWYAEGAEHLLAVQRADGGWGAGLPDVCFALLFLRRTTFSAGPELEALTAAIPVPERAAEPQLAPEVPRLVDWLLCGPWGGGPKDDPLAAPPFDPARAKPREGAQLARRDWTRVALRADGWTNLEELTGKHGDRLLWAMALCLRSDEQREALLWLQLEDGWRVWLDGKELSAERRMQAPIEENVRVPLALRPGVAHALLVLVEDWRGSSAFGARLSDPAGRPLPAGLRVGADFAGREKR